MAKYNREFLVPYLQDVCSMEMLCNKLEKSIEKVQNVCNTAKYHVNYRLPEPVLENYEGRIANDKGDFMAMALFGLVFVAIGLVISPFLSLFLIYDDILWFLFWAYIIWCGWWGLVFMGGNNEYRAKAEIHNQELLDEYQRKNRTVENNKIKYRRILKEKSEELEALYRQKKKALDVLEELYEVDIIPAQYRNAYVAYYLYDYFNTSRETDLDKIIQTLLLNEIVQRLDCVIKQNEEMLINQRYEIAMQETQNKITMENHKAQMKQLAKMEHNQEMQQDYLAMIESSARVTELFTTLDYFERHL